MMILDSGLLFWPPCIYAYRNNIFLTIIN